GTLEKDDLPDALFESQAIVTAMVNAVQASQAQIEAGRARKNYAEWLRDAQSNLFAHAQTSELESKKAQRDFLEADVDVQESTSHAFAMQALLAVCRLMPIYVNRQLKRTQLVSPVDGVVLKRYLWNEQVMQPGDRLMDIGNLDDLQITADVLTEEAVTIHPGDPVEIFGETIGDAPIQGKVLRVKPQAFTKLSSLGVEQQRVAVKIAFDPEALQPLANAKQQLGLEYRVQVRIYTETQPDALIIPRTALFRSDDGQWQVFRILRGRAQTVTLKLGIVNDAQAQVLEGLQPDDTVIIAPDSTLKDGIRVTPRKS
ncbi:MAG: HlyD family efflux transporter periplasmic adaptor subunit, partial [Kiritimatiellae bacterium]|nr:HlyD family efflux transporter periplasmic adaptor subunit [Kiritimatiellia bacterium]